MSTMRAVVIREPGGPEVLEVQQRPAPEPAPSEIRVKVAFAGVNRADLLQRMGRYPAPPSAPGDIPGLEYVGVVDAVGPYVTRFRVGDRVFGVTAGGAYAEYLCVHEREAVSVPSSVDSKVAAAVPEAFVTAYDALFVRGRLTPGARVLIHAVGSGVGTAGLAIAKAMGCTVIGTSRTQAKLDALKPLGLDVGIFAPAGTFADEIRVATNGGGVDVVLDLVGGGYVDETLKVCAQQASIVLVGLTGGARGDIDLGAILRRRVTLVGTVLRSRPIEEKILAAQLLEKNIVPWLVNQRVQPVIDRVFPLEKAGDAHAYVASDASLGKVLLSV
ncbi:MAG: NAD(P)H-quinone oxidoreductase [Polyangiaceae bacterium]